MFKPLTIDNYKTRRIAWAFLLFVFVFECFVIGVNYSNYFVYLLAEESFFFITLAAVSILLSFYLFYHFIVFTLSAAWAYRLICILIFALSLCAEYGYQKALGRFSDKIDIETAVATTHEQQIASISMYFSFAAIIPVAVLIILLIFLRSEKQQEMRHFLIANGLLIACFAIFPIVVSRSFPTFATNAFYRTTTDFLTSGPIVSGKWASDVTGIAVKRRHVRKPKLTDNYRPGNNVVIIVDESVRGDHLSLNGYHRETTPLLDALARRNILHNWGIAAAASTGSRYTYGAMITGLTPDDFPDKTDFKINTFPTIFQYAKAMNYKTYFFDGQMKAYWGGIEDDKAWLDSWQGVLDIPEAGAYKTWEPDNLIAKKVKNIIYSSTGNFIFVFKRGSHIPYSNNYPPDQEIWRPSYTTDNKYDIPSGDQLPDVVNAYDNSIRFNINSFFETLVDDYSQIPNNSIIIYTGDHGQTLFEGRRSSHGGSTYAEANVPLFIIGKLAGTVDTNYKASHQNLYPTILDLIDYPAELRERATVPSLLKARSSDSKPRFFNPDLGYKVGFD